MVGGTLHVTFGSHIHFILVHNINFYIYNNVYYLGMCSVIFFPSSFDKALSGDTPKKTRVVSLPLPESLYKKIKKRAMSEHTPLLHPPGTLSQFLCFRI